MPHRRSIPRFLPRTRRPPAYAHASAPASHAPVGYQFGYVFARGPEDRRIKTAAHELGHGRFQLRHTFVPPLEIADTTDKLMSYHPTGTTLCKRQWDYLHDPQWRVFRFLQGEEEGRQSSKYIQITHSEVIRPAGRGAIAFTTSLMNIPEWITSSEYLARNGDKQYSINYEVFVGERVVCKYTAKNIVKNFSPAWEWNGTFDSGKRVSSKDTKLELRVSVFNFPFDVGVGYHSFQISSEWFKWYTLPVSTPMTLAVEDFSPQKTTNDCDKQCRELLTQKGIAGPMEGERIHLACNYDASTMAYDIHSKCARKAVEVIDQHLNAGEPIIVAVDHGAKRIQNDHVTDHWIVLVAREVNQGVVRYRLFDVGNGKGASQSAYLTLRDDFVLEGKLVLRDDPCVLTQVCPNRGFTFNCCNLKVKEDDKRDCSYTNEGQNVNGRSIPKEGNQYPDAVKPPKLDDK